MFADTECVILLCSGDQACSCVTYHPVFGPSPSLFVEKYKKWTKLSVVDGYSLCWVQVSRCFAESISKTLFSFVFLNAGWMTSLGNRRLQTWVLRVNCYTLRSFWKCLLWQNTLQFWPHTSSLSPVWYFEKSLWGQHCSSDEVLQNTICRWLQRRAVIRVLVQRWKKTFEKDGDSTKKCLCL